MPRGFSPDTGAPRHDVAAEEAPAVHPNAAASYVAALEAERDAAKAVGNSEQASVVDKALADFKSARLGSKDAAVETRSDSTPGPKSSQS
jgi:hypothetical protein